MNSPVRVAIALGSNLGDRQHHLAFARLRLSSILSDFRMSSAAETEPVDVPGRQAAFLNAVAVGTTELTADELLHALQAIETEAGRERPFPGAARTLDLDLILFGMEIRNDPSLAIPHPRFRDRRFVLEPLAEIAPELRDPITMLTVAELLARLPPAR